MSLTEVSGIAFLFDLLDRSLPLITERGISPTVREDSKDALMKPSLTVGLVPRSYQHPTTSCLRIISARITACECDIYNSTNSHFKREGAER